MMLNLNPEFPPDAHHILVIEDDDIVARTIERSLRNQAFRVTLARSGVEGLKFARRRVPDLVVLDIIMPGMDGYNVCREIRSDPILHDVPILFLTARVKDEDKITGFTLGADDYLCKPFNPEELVLRLRAIIRRAQRLGGQNHKGGQLTHEKGESTSTPGAKDTHILQVGGYKLDRRLYLLHTSGGEKVQLTPVQFELLNHLMSNAEEIFSPERLLDEVWDYPSHTGSPDLVRVHIKNLRQKVEEDPRNPKFIRTIPGYGYTVSMTDD